MDALRRLIAADVVERALWTFVQAALGVLVVSSTTDLTDVSNWGAAAVAGVASALSVVKTYAKDRLGSV